MRRGLSGAAARRWRPSRPGGCSSAGAPTPGAGPTRRPRRADPADRRAAPLRLARRREAGRRARPLRASRAAAAGARPRCVDRRVHRLPPAGRRRAGRRGRRRARPAGVGAAHRPAGHRARAHQRPRPRARATSAGRSTSRSPTCPSSRCSPSRPRSRAAPRPDADLVLLVKPQFEAGRAAVGKGGIVRDPDVHRGGAPRGRATACARRAPRGRRHGVAVPRRRRERRVPRARATRAARRSTTTALDAAPTVGPSERSAPSAWSRTATARDAPELARHAVAQRLAAHGIEVR